ncbi:MAG: S1 RNA-binding domain-containing protein [Angelakisella sp.]
MQVAVGNIVEGKVAKITNYGAFIDLEGGGTGMVHISEIANSYVKDINDHITVGETVTVKVIGINEQNKVSLSIKEMQPAPEQSSFRPQQGGDRNAMSRPPLPRQSGPRSSAPRSFNKPAAVPSTGDPFEDMMNRFKKTSDDKLSDLKKVMDPRKGSSRRTHTK